MIYAYSVLMQPIQDELQISKSVVVGAYSVALLISGCLSTIVGSIIDRFGGRRLMCAGSVLSAIMLGLLSQVQSVTGLYLAWAGIGAAMSATLYPPAFVVLTQVFGPGYRRAITMLTLYGGLASTVFWPLTQLLYDLYGWRDTWLIYAGINLLLCLPIHAAIPAFSRLPAGAAAKEKTGGNGLFKVLHDPLFYSVCIALTLNALVASAVSLHLILILQDRGLSAVNAAAIGAMIGPMQVLGRVVEMMVAKTANTRQVGLVAMWLLPLALVFLLIPSQSLSIYFVFAIAYGLSIGIMTIVRGTLPAELWGREGYGAISGTLSSPSLFARAAGPVVASLLYTFAGGYAGAILFLTLIGALAAGLFIYVAACSRIPAIEPEAAD